MPDDKNDRLHMDDIYRSVPLEEIAWNIETPPQLLVELIDKGTIKPCKTIDLGCGAGNYAIYLASRGFDVTGVDFSAEAVKIAKQNAKKKKVKCAFYVADVIEDLPDLNQTWDFACEWGILHYIFPQYRPKYVRNVHQILNPGAKYLSVCFSEKDTAFVDSGKYRNTPSGSLLYFSSEDELRELFSPSFKILDLRTVEIVGKFENHFFNYCFMEKK